MILYKILSCQTGAHNPWFIVYKGYWVPIPTAYASYGSGELGEDEQKDLENTSIVTELSFLKAAVHTVIECAESEEPDKVVAYHTELQKFYKVKNEISAWCQKDINATNTVKEKMMRYILFLETDLSSKIRGVLSLKATLKTIDKKTWNAFNDFVNSEKRKQEISKVADTVTVTLNTAFKVKLNPKGVLGFFGKYGDE